MRLSVIGTLTDREWMVIEALLHHAGTSQVASRLGISEHTARRHIEHVMRKLGISSRHDVRHALGLSCDCAQRRMAELRQQVMQKQKQHGSKFSRVARTASARSKRTHRRSD